MHWLIVWKWSESEMTGSPGTTKPHSSVSSRSVQSAPGVHSAHTVQYTLLSFMSVGLASVWHTCVTVHGAVGCGS